MDPSTAQRATPPSELSDLFFGHTGHLAYKWTHFLPAYDEQFQKLRRGFIEPDGHVRPLRMLEIGVSRGGSLQLWRRYFGREAVICGIDIDERCASITDDDLMIRIGSQADPDFLLQVVEEMGGVDLVLDDGSHIGAHQLASFRTLFPMLPDGGLYAIEDLHTSYWREFRGGYQSKGGFIETLKVLIDDMHGPYHHKPDTLGVAAHEWIPRISFYDSIAFVAKASRPRPMVTMVGTPTF